MRAVSQGTQRDMAIAIPVGKIIWQDVIARLENIPAMDAADHLQMRGVDDNFSADRNGRFQLIHGLVGSPKFILHGRSTR